MTYKKNSQEKNTVEGGEDSEGNGENLIEVRD